MKETTTAEKKETKPIITTQNRVENKQLTPDDEKAKIEKQLENQILKFIKSKDTEYDFPSSLGGNSQ